MIKVKEVLQCLINGKSISGISSHVKITRNTVKSTDQRCIRLVTALKTIALTRMN